MPAACSGGEVASFERKGRSRLHSHPILFLPTLLTCAFHRPTTHLRNRRPLLGSQVWVALRQLHCRRRRIQKAAQPVLLLRIVQRWLAARPAQGPHAACAVQTKSAARCGEERRGKGFSLSFIASLYPAAAAAAVRCSSRHERQAQRASQVGHWLPASVPTCAGTFSLRGTVLCPQGCSERSCQTCKGWHRAAVDGGAAFGGHAGTVRWLIARSASRTR